MFARGRISSLSIPHSTERKHVEKHLQFHKEQLITLPGTYHFNLCSLVCTLKMYWLNDQVRRFWCFQPRFQYFCGATFCVSQSWLYFYINIIPLPLNIIFTLHHFILYKCAFTTWIPKSAMLTLVTFGQRENLKAVISPSPVPSPSEPNHLTSSLERIL